MYLSRHIQTYILKILYEYDEIWSSPFYLVNKHFFTVYKSLVGSQLTFIFDSHKDEIKFKSFVKFVTGTDRLNNKPYFIYEQLEKLTICILERNKDQILLTYDEEKDDDYEFTFMSSTISELLRSKQWKEWDSTLNHDIDVQIIDPYYYLGWNSFKNFSCQVTHLDICINVEEEQLSPPMNLQSLNLATYDGGHGDPNILYKQLINYIRDLEHITKLSLSSPRFSIKNSMKLFNCFGDQLTRLEILKQDYNDGNCSDLFHFLNEHSNIKEFGITEGYEPYKPRDMVPEIVDYLFSEECHIDTITQVSLHSDSIRPIKRRIPYMLVSMRMVTNFDIDSRKDNPDINKVELKKQIDNAILEFSHIDHLVLCYRNRPNDNFLIDDFVILANAVKDHNSSLNKKVEIYYRNLNYQLLNHDVKGLSRRIAKYKIIGFYNFRDGDENECDLFL